MMTKCAGCGCEIARQHNNYGEFWYGFVEKGDSHTAFAVLADDQPISIVGHQKLYFCPECLLAAQQHCSEAQNALDHFAIALRWASLGARYRYFTRRDFAQLQF